MATTGTSSVHAADVAHLAPVDVPLPAWRTRVVAAGLSAVAGGVHLWVLPEHAEESRLFGLLFLAAGLGQLCCAVLLLVRQRIDAIAVLGVVGNSGVLAAYVLSRTSGLPLGPHAWEPEAVARLDYATAAAEVLLIGILVATLGGSARRRAVNAVLGLGVALWLARAFGG